MHCHIQHLSKNNLMVSSRVHSVCRTGEMDVRPHQLWLARGPLDEVLFKGGVTPALSVMSR